MVFGGMHHTPHGMTNAIFMNSILKRYAAKKPHGAMDALAKIICEELGADADAAGAFGALNGVITGLIKLDPLGNFGMKRESAGVYAQKVLDTQQRLIVNSYTKLTAAELTEVFEELC
jgi:4-hydroxybutyrate dehydrogenase